MSSDGRLAPGLIREQQREEPCADDQRARDVHRDGSLEVRVQRDDWSLHSPKRRVNEIRGEK